VNDHRIVLMGCAQSAGAAIQELQDRGQPLPDYVEWVRLPCGSSLDELHILRAFESGADRVMVLACYDGACRSVNGNRWAEKRVEAARAILEEVGIPGWRLAFQQVAPTMAADVLQWIADFEAAQPPAQDAPDQGAENEA
jgi:coenzyme F420-reducing hydrogenase delta subunit